MKQLEAEVVERNAWRVAQNFVSRIDGEPGPADDCMKAFVTNHDFIESCMITGEIFHEYCENESVDPTPRPVPDINKLPKYHCLPNAETPITNTDDSKRREVIKNKPQKVNAIMDHVRSL
ncbi:unnamed protein product, partial [Porites lobata]